MKDTKKILIVDDEPGILDSLKFLLSSELYEIDQAADGEEALGKIMKNSYHTVICDYSMPRMDGITLLSKIRENNDYTPFIFLSGKSNQEDVREMASLGAFRIVEKTEILHIQEILEQTLHDSEELNKLKEDSTAEHEDFLKILHSTKAG